MPNNTPTTNATNNILTNLAQVLKAANDLNKLNKTDCPAYKSLSEQDPATKLLVNSTTKTCLCQTLYSLIGGSSSFSETLFSQVKPILVGKLLYAPNTPAINLLIKNANKTYSNIENFGNLMISLADLASQSASTLNQSTSFFQTVLDTVQSQTNITLLQNLTVTDLIVQLQFAEQLLRFSRNLLNCVELDRFIGYSSEKEAIDIGKTLIDKESFWSSIIFQNVIDSDNVNDSYKLPKIVNYKIRMDSTKTHDTTNTQDRYYKFGASTCYNCNRYFLYGFIYIQDMLEKAIIETKTNQTNTMGITTQMTPYPCYVDDRFVAAIARSLPLFMVLAWIYTISMLVKDIVYEKEKRLKEFMRVMGLTNATHWFSWFITSFIAMFFVSFLLCLIIKYGKVVTFSEITVLFVFYGCFSIATITQCFLISVFFNKANLASVVAGIIYFLLYLPYTILVNYSEVLETWQKFLASLSSTVAFGYGFEIIGTYELQNKGATWANFNQSPYSTKNSYSLFVVCLILLFDAFLYMVLTLYIENISPGEYGISKPWYFIISPNYWFGDLKCFKNLKLRNTIGSNRFFDKIFNNILFDSKRKIIADEAKREEQIKNSLTTYSIQNLDNEHDLKPGIEIDALHKVYSRGNNHALKGLSLKFYQNEISAFLGHNGAGKSTTMHLLTGLYKPTSGSAKIDGLSITDSMNKIRKSLGFVPQHNILFPLLTVKEHLWFYARLKGLNRAETKNEMNKLLEDTGLQPKKNDFSQNLSGGMQRKLSGKFYNFLISSS